MIMRNFILLTSINRVMKEPGIHSRFIQGAILASRESRRDVNVYLVFPDINKYILIRGDSARGVLPDESSVSLIIKSLFMGRKYKGIIMGDAGLSHILRSVGGSLLVIPLILECRSPIRLRNNLSLIVNYYSSELDELLCGRGHGLPRLPPDQASIIINYAADNELIIK